MIMMPIDVKFDYIKFRNNAYIEKIIAKIRFTQYH